ncbi:MAG: hypothetical protein V1740_07295 [Candidatus Woesearchaeota archaeon]
MKRILLAILIVLGLFLAGCPVEEATTATTQKTTTIVEVTDTTQASGSSASAPNDADIRVLGAEGFDPDVITLAAGATVTWIVPGESDIVEKKANVDEDTEEVDEEDLDDWGDDQLHDQPDIIAVGRVHLISSNNGLFRSPRLSAGDKFTYTFEEPGEYEYTNVIWGRKGTVVVE